MERHEIYPDPKTFAAQMDAEIRALKVRNTPNVREIRRRYSRELKVAPSDYMLALVQELVERYSYRGYAYELIQFHKGAFQSLGEAELESLGRGIDSWWSVDSFARILSGPAWLKGQIKDGVIHKWAHSEDLWWRRAALVSTVALNIKASGGVGDTRHTLEVCRLLVGDHEDMVVKAMSWALLELVGPDSGAVREFLAEHEDALAARVKREVRNKLETGLKYPKRKKK